MESSRHNKSLTELTRRFLELTSANGEVDLNRARDVLQVKLVDLHPDPVSKRIQTESASTGV